MHAKHGRLLHIVALICATILYFQPLLPIYRSGKRPAKTARSSAASAKKAQQAVLESQKTPTEEKAAIDKQEESEEFAVEKDMIDAKNDQLAKAEAQKAAEAQVSSAEPVGFFSKAYAMVAPLILVTLNAAVGVAIEAGTKSLLKGFGKRPELLEQKALAEENDLQLQSKLREKYPDQIKKQELDLIPEKDLEPLIKNSLALEELDKKTSYSYIFSNAAYTMMIYTIISAVAKLTGYGATMTFQSFMPAGQK